MKKQLLQKNIALTIIGSALMGLGISITEISQLGSDPLTAFWVGLSRLYNITIGEANLYSAFFMLLFPLLLD